LDPTLEKFLFVGLGWVLGLTSPLIVDYMKRRRENEEAREALRVELAELRYRLAAVAHSVQVRFGEVTRESLLWLRPIVVSYTGLNPVDRLLQEIDKTLELSDAQIAQLSQSTKSPPEKGMALKKYVAPLLDSKFSLLSSQPLLQNQLSEVRVHLGLFNEEVDQTRYYFQLTFSSISNENKDRAVQNLVGCYANAAHRAKIIADQIGKIMW
jgi:hypothetical protein